MVENAQDERLDHLFAALSDRSRRRILADLLEDDLSVGEVAAKFEMSLAAVSKHIQALARAGLITQEKRGRERICKLDPEALRPVLDWAESIGQISGDRFDQVELFLIETLGADALGEEADQPLTRPDA